MTPAAKPDRERCRFRFICPPSKNTQAAPRAVPRKGMNIAKRILGVIVIFLSVILALLYYVRTADSVIKSRQRSKKHRLLNRTVLFSWCYSSPKR
jgi:hypothetical protein